LFYQIKTSKQLRLLYRGATWFIPNHSKSIYLTFDDGPVEGITDKTLEILEQYQAKATFFCVGDNIIKNRSLFDSIKANGHSIGNHTQNHLNGWMKSTKEYLNNWELCNKHHEFKYFRPPYGKIKRSQYKHISKNQEVIFWDVLGGDFDQKQSVNDVISNVTNNTEAGSIIVLHDNEKCGEKMLKSLPSIIENLQGKGFIFDNLDSVI